MKDQIQYAKCENPNCGKVLKIGWGLAFYGGHKDGKTLCMSCRVAKEAQEDKIRETASEVNDEMRKVSDDPDYIPGFDDGETPKGEIAYE